jgi:hypothetical protein
VASDPSLKVLTNLKIFNIIQTNFYLTDGPKARYVRNKSECLSDPRNTWLNRKYNFDNLGQVCIQ